MDFLQLIKTILGVLPFLALCFICAKINLNKVNRSRQFLMPIIALVYSILGVVLVDYISDLVHRLIVLLSQYVPFLKNLNWQAIAIFVLNAALMLGFIFIKSLLLPILNKIWSSNKVSEATSGLFYEREEDVDKWLLKPGFTNLRGYVKGFYVGTFIATIIIFILSQNMPKSILFQAEFYPIFGVLFLVKMKKCIK